MIKTITINEEIKKDLVEHYQLFQTNPPQYASHAFKLTTFSIVVYNSLKVVFNGEFNDDEVDQWVSQTGYFKYDIIGSDEVGTGDFFGPIVVASVYIKETDIPLLKRLNVMDSKSLSDEVIMRIAGELILNIEHKYTVCNNETYNRFYEKGFHIKQILALLHDKTITTLDKDCEVIIDQFVEKQVFEKYLKKQNEYTFVTKGETKYCAIAAASIIARAYFVKEMQKMENELNEIMNTNINIPYGASDIVDDYGRKVLSVVGEKNLIKYVKMNFKNLEKIKEK